LKTFWKVITRVDINQEGNATTQEFMGTKVGQETGEQADK
jgi:hypothetical protein